MAQATPVNTCCTAFVRSNRIVSYCSTSHPTGVFVIIPLVASDSWRMSDVMLRLKFRKFVLQVAFCGN